MKIFYLFLLLSSSVLYAKYLSNKSCKECHEDIYYEYQSSYHAKTYFNDELHRKVANKASNKTYDCAVCHMPGAKNLKELISGKERPHKDHIEQHDAISCIYCHQIAYVKKAHEHNINIRAKQLEGYKPNMYGSLENPDDSDKHAMLNNPIYDKNVCLGCHSHKRNKNDVLIFQTVQKNQDSTECIKCHMPLIDGGAEKDNKRGRLQHHSHTFAGIHSLAMMKESVNLSVKIDKNKLFVTIKNKMPHPLIIQAARLKYLDIQIKRDGKIIWKNFKKSPLEDKQGAFHIEFLDEHNQEVIIPSFAKKRGFVNNLNAKETKTLIYNTPNIQKGDTISVILYVILAKPNCQKAITLDDPNLTKPQLMQKYSYKVE
jgi:hypothetical protein